MIWNSACSLMVFFVAVNAAFAENRAVEVPAKKITANSGPYINRDFCAALVIHPERIANSKLGRSISLGKFAMGIIKRSGIDLKPYGMLSNPEKIRRITILAEGFPGGNVIFMPAAIIEFVEETDGKKLFPSMWPDGSFSEGDKRIYESHAFLAKAPVTAVSVSPRTVLIAPEFMMNKMLGENVGLGNLLFKQLEDLHAMNDIHLEYNSKPALLNMLKLMGTTVEKLRSDTTTDHWIKIVLLDIKSCSLNLNLNGKKLVQGKVECDGLEAANQLKGLLNNGLHRFSPMEENRNPTEGSAKTQTSKLAELLQNVASETQITQKSETLELDIAMPKSLHPFLLQAAKATN